MSGGRRSGHRGGRRGFLGRHRKLVVVLAVAACALAGCAAVMIVEALQRGADYLEKEKIVTGTSGKKYTVGEAVDRAVEKSEEQEREREKQR